MIFILNLSYYITNDNETKSLDWSMISYLLIPQNYLLLQQTLFIRLNNYSIIPRLRILIPNTFHASLLLIILRDSTSRTRSHQPTIYIYIYTLEQLDILYLYYVLVSTFGRTINFTLVPSLSLNM